MTIIIMIMVGHWYGLVCFEWDGMGRYTVLFSLFSRFFSMVIIDKRYDPFFIYFVRFSFPPFLKRVVDHSCTLNITIFFFLLLFLHNCQWFSPTHHVFKRRSTLSRNSYTTYINTYNIQEGNMVLPRNFLSIDFFDFMLKA